jgi:hypothetical protein
MATDAANEAPRAKLCQTNKFVVNLLKTAGCIALLERFHDARTLTGNFHRHHSSRPVAGYQPWANDACCRASFQRRESLAAWQFHRSVISKIIVDRD